MRFSSSPPSKPYIFGSAGVCRPSLKGYTAFLLSRNYMSMIVLRSGRCQRGASPLLSGCCDSGAVLRSDRCQRRVSPLLCESYTCSIAVPSYTSKPRNLKEQSQIYMWDVRRPSSRLAAGTYGYVLRHVSKLLAVCNVYICCESFPPTCSSTHAGIYLHLDATRDVTSMVVHRNQTEYT